jgi:hypothetical protein
MDTLGNPNPPQSAIDNNVRKSRIKEAARAAQEQTEDIAAYSADVVRCNALRLAEDIAFKNLYKDII